MAVSTNKKQSSLMRFVGNKNVVTLLGIAACIGILVVGYTYRVNNSVATMTVPFARRTLEARSIINGDDIGNVRITTSYVENSSNIITDASEVAGKAVAYYSNIPSGSLFYSSAIMDPDALPNASFKDIGEGNTIYSLSVDAESTYSNSVRAGDYIDLYMAAADPNQEKMIVFGCFIESIRVLAVKDEHGRNILKNSLDYGTPAELLFAVDDEYYLLLKDAEFLEIELVPVLHNAAYTQNGTAESTRVNSEYLRAIITSQVMDYRE